ncbi:MAG: hypothetical protein JWP01_4196 [Myxococcales bacterium]|nr:hypothetical protein [Myxococcales bacterium]
MAPVPTWFRVGCGLMAALFGLCVVLQVNDPDPLRWMMIYGMAAVTTALLPANKPVAAIALIVGLIALAWAMYLIQSIWGVVALSDVVEKMSEKGGAVEVEREAGGLMIEGVWLLFAASFRGTRA